MSKNHRRSGARLPRAQQSTHALGDPDAGGAGHRKHRLERILHDELQSIIRDEATDPALDGVALISINLSSDGGHARVAYVVEAQLANERHVERSTREALTRATGFLRARLASQLDLKRLPKLTFTFVGVRAPGMQDSEEGGES